MQRRQVVTSREQAGIKRTIFKIILLMSFICSQVVLSRQIEFINEEIELRVGDSTCVVTGLYWFRNVDTVTVTKVLFYPFVVTEYLPYPDTIVVTDVSNGRQAHFTRGKRGIVFAITVSAFETALYHVSYTQKTPAHSMEYLLLTTAQWGKPLGQALYRVRMPKENILTFSTILFSHRYEQNNEEVYESCEENFMPLTNFTIQWEGRLP